ncbi:hypothetical protein BDV97DRAFT_396963 [Delphinella strobiligena]|nr:hypothetical protein BDV97DRAFT_396963 [Delphinella strobiligena]
MGSYMANTPQTVHSIQVVAYNIYWKGPVPAGSIHWALYLRTVNGDLVTMNMGTGPSLTDLNDEIIRSRLCSIDYTPGNSFTPDDLWREIRSRRLDRYDLLWDGVGWAYWILLVFCLLEDLGLVEVDTLPHLLDWVSSTSLGVQSPDEAWLKLGTFHTE